MEGKKPILCIVGPTCSGKSRLAVELAKKLSEEGFEVEIVVADSRKIYKFFDIGTAKPREYITGEVKAHLVSSLDPRKDSFSAKRFERMAREIVRDILRRGHVPLIEGGTWLYIRAFEFGLLEEPEGSDGMRQELEKLSTQELWRILEREDPKATEKIHPNDRYRILRAILIRRRTGFSVADGVWGERFEYPLVKFGIFWGWKRMRRRLEERTQRLIDMGLFDEVRELVRMLGKEHQLLKSISYKESILYLEGKATQGEVKELIIRNNLKYAKYQVKVFSREGTIWLPSSSFALQYLSELVRRWYGK